MAFGFQVRISSPHCYLVQYCFLSKLIFNVYFFRTASSKGETSSQPPPPTGGGANTGPKGVIADWRRFKQLETEKREEQVQPASVELAFII